jgi:hypothetical protein
MIDDIRRALAITPASNAWQRTADITTTGRRSGRPHRVETWFYRYDDRIYLSGLPGRRDWLANLRDNPRLIFHLKHGARADLPASAQVVTDDELRRKAFTHFVADLNQPHNPARIAQPTDVESWLAGSPLVQVVFDDERLGQ